VQDLIQQDAIRKAIRAEDFITEEAGIPTITDILKELARPGRDPRDTIKSFFFANIKKPEDLTLAMVVPGIVTKITRFGCFVDIGVKQDGMAHISQMADKFISDPHEIVKLQQQVQVKVTEVDMERKRIGLSMKGV
jgi:protein Tex